MLQARRRSNQSQLLAILGFLGVALTGGLPGSGSEAAAPRARNSGKTPAPGPVSPLEAPGWSVQREWLIAGSYVEVSNDRGICPGFFGAASCGGTSRKVIVLQILDGHYKSISLKSLSAALLVESPTDEPLLWSNRARWKRADLFLPAEADSLQGEALVRTIGATFNGLGGPAFTRIERLPLGVGIARERVRVNAADRLDILLRPVAGGNPEHPPQVQNQADPFPFLGYLSISRADTLFARPGDGSGDWSWSGTAGVVSSFGWSSERAAETQNLKR